MKGKKPVDNNNGEEAVEHGSWSGTAQFFITSLGSAVGLGNVWRFPNVVYQNGGAAFIVAYIIALIFIAIPILLLEASIGQYSKKGPVGVWDLSPLFRGVGFATLWNSFCFIIYYNTPVAWAAYYFVNSMTAELPWKSLDNDTSSVAAEDYFYNNTLKITDSVNEWGGFSWELYLCNGIMFLVLYGGVSLGASSLGKIAYFTSLFPYVVLTVMIGYTATLDGALEGVKYYITEFKWEKLAEISVWRDAVAQVFFSTSCALGTVIQLSSYNSFNHNIYRDAIVIPICDGLTSIFAGFSVFTVLGYMSVKTNSSIEDVVEAGPGLIFITYPEAFSNIAGGNVWSVFFFFMVMILGISSQLPLIDMCCGVLADLFTALKRTRLRNMLFRLSFVLLCFGVSIFFYFGFGYYWYYLVDERIAGLPLMIVSVFELVGIGWFYSKPFHRDRLLKDIEKMVSSSWSPTFRSIWSWSKYYWVLCWAIIAPVLLVFILIYDLVTIGPLVLEINDDAAYTYPEWAVSISWGIIALSPFLVVVGMFYVTCYQYFGYKIWIKAVEPNENWKAANKSESGKRSSSMSSIKDHHDLEAPVSPSLSAGAVYSTKIPYDLPPFHPIPAEMEESFNSQSTEF